MIWISPLAVGVACLAVGLLAGYSIPRQPADPTEEEQPATALAIQPNAPRPRIPETKAKYAFKFPATTATAKKTPEAQRTLSSSPVDNDKSKAQWLQNLSRADLPQVISEMCQIAGPNGLSNDDRWLLNGVLAKWWREDEAGLLAWLRQLPNNRSKRYLLATLLQRMGSTNPSRAMALAESFKAADPEWDNGDLLNSFVEREVNKAWQRPGITAEEMLTLYGRYSRDGNCFGYPLKIYPSNFDFRTFLDGIAALNRQDGKQPARMPPDILQAWVKVDPQAAAEWLLQHEATKDKNGEVSFVGWDDIAKGITARSGPQAYHQWAAGIVTQGQGELRAAILRESNDQQLAGIVEQIPGAATRDAVLSAAIASSGSYGRDELTRLGLVSTPEARLRVIAENTSSLSELIRRGRTDPSLWPRVGLTPDQVDAALLGEAPQ
jgi:hypothetical protein